MSNRKSPLHLRTLPPALAALGSAVGFSGSALAQTGNPTTGATLYKLAVPIRRDSAGLRELLRTAPSFKAGPVPMTTEAGTW
jgi:hypothetical protein